MQAVCTHNLSGIPLHEQVFYRGAGETSYMDYDQEELESGLTASFHEMSEPEFNGKWCRVWYVQPPRFEVPYPYAVLATSPCIHSVGYAPAQRIVATRV